MNCLDEEQNLIVTSRLYEYIKECCWDINTCISLSDISLAYGKNVPVQREKYADSDSCLLVKHRSKAWHLGRILYFINHPEEICDIEIDNRCDGLSILAEPIIQDGNHRYLAAAWLCSKGLGMKKIPCRYGGRLDLLSYLTGESDDRPDASDWFI